MPSSSPTTTNHNIGLPNKTSRVVLALATLASRKSRPLSRFLEFSWKYWCTSNGFLLLKPLQSPLPTPLFSYHLLLIRPLFPSITLTTSTNCSNYKNCSASPPILNCLVSDVDDDGIVDDFVFTRQSGFDREFSVITSMLKRIKPFDSSVISKGVSKTAKDSMKHTISVRLGLLPSD
ncbi:hypothetical protein NE237_006796 [Protea cynaroides]|uniref:Uncharacterized protein n=1 Tax=Protea cynaroides TaxID=273540 RepID=A0A9Q0KN70_9MAGN|nr:hypothetical protein NE237_006796 [Protea cynaroides]